MITLLYRIIFVLIALILFAFTSNVFLKSAGKKIFNSVERVLAGLGISVIVYLILGFLLEGPIDASKYTVAVIDGLLVGWIIGLFTNLKEV